MKIENLKLKILPLFFLTIVILLFFWQFIFKGLLPIPSDTIIGLYHPFRDFYAKDYPNGIPFKNFLITDPVRQQYPWRELSLSIEKRLELPLWNSYNFSGTPLLANFQSSVFYPLNILFLLPFNIGWSILILLGPLLAGIFLYFYLDNLKLNKWACFLGAMSFSFSGFFISWMEWGTITHTALWLPLILLSVDKLFSYFEKKVSDFRFQVSGWSALFVFSLVSSFFAGHLQTFFYLFLLSLAYFLIRWIQYGRNKIQMFLFLISYFLFFIVSSVQWIPTLQFILLSARDIDQSLWQQEGWFIPWQNLIQFIAPDFFGNPATLNYWGAWNYGEFIGYIGIAPLLMAIFALFFRHDKKTLFFGILFFLSLIFSLPTFFAKIPYLLNLPMISTSQPTRLLFIADFSLSILAALGFDYFLKRKNKIILPMLFMVIALVSLWSFVLFKGLGLTLDINLAVSKNNLIFPTLIFMVISIFILAILFFTKRKKIVLFVSLIIFTATVFDLLRFGLKFTPFTNKEYLFPATKTIEFLQKNSGHFRIMTTDSRILPPNFSAVYRVQSIDGYDPLYLKRYAELIAASERGEPNISPPFGFNRIITPKNYDSKIIDLLGVKYVLSLSDISSEKLNKVFQEGQTQIYENKDVLPRVFFAENIIQSKNKTETITKMFNKDFNAKDTAIIEESAGVNINSPLGCKNCRQAEIVYYSENKVVIDAKNDIDGFLVLTDSFYPTWKAKVDNKITPVYRADYNFRGIFVPKGKHRVEFYNSLF